MTIKDKVVLWYLKNILIPRSEIIDKPGFIATQFSDGKNKIYIRELAFQENLMSNLESKVIELHGDEGKQVLYSAGKKATYNYANLSLFPSYGHASDKELISFMNETAMFLEATYAKEIKPTIYFEEKRLDLELKDYFVCSKNGHGYLLTSGGAAGIWAWIRGDMTIEAVQTECQGRNGNRCKLICAPVETLKTYSAEIFTEPKLEKLHLLADYNIINGIRLTKYGHLSLQNLINAGIFQYKHGGISYLGERYLLDEAHLVYYLDNEFSKLSDGHELLFQVGFDYGKNLNFETHKGPSSSKNFIMDYLTALGWGDVLVKKSGSAYTVITSYFPWSELFRPGQDFPMFRGLVSGLLSAQEKTDIHLKIGESKLIGNNLIVSLIS